MLVNLPGRMPFAWFAWFAVYSGTRGTRPSEIRPRPGLAVVPAFCPVVAGGDIIGFVWNLRPNLAAAR